MITLMSTAVQDPKVGPRTWIYAVLAVLSVTSPELVVRYGPFLAVLVVLTGNPGRLRIGAQFVAATGFAGWALTASLWAVNPTAAQQSAVSFIAIVAVFIGAVDLIKTVGQLRVVAAGFVTGSILTLVEGLTQNGGDSGEGQRLALEGVNPNFIGYSSATAFAMLILLWVTRRGGRGERLLLTAIAIGFAVGVEATDSRGAYIGLLLVVTWLALSKMLSRPPLRALIIALAGASIVTIFGFMDDRLGALDFGDRATGDWSGRLDLWPAARLIWQEHLWGGVGAGRFAEVSGYEIGAHNVFLHLGAGLGVVGVAFYIAVWVFSLRPPVKAGPEAALIVGSFIAASAPAYLTGYWETAPAAWMALALFSRVGVIGLRSVNEPAPTEAQAVGVKNVK